MSGTPFADPDLLLALNYFFIFGSILLAILILFPTFVSLRVDHKVLWSWAVVFIPLFVVDAVVFLGLLVNPAGDEEGYVEIGEEDEHEEEGTSYEENRADRILRNEERKMKRRKQGILMKGIRVVIFLLVLTFQILIVLRLDKIINLRWILIFAPWFAVELYNLIQTLRNLKDQLKKGVLAPPSMDPESLHDQPPLQQLNPTQKILLTLSTITFPVLRILQLVLLALKLDATLTGTWSLIFLPTWMWGIVTILLFFAEYKTIPETMGPNPQRVAFFARVIIKTVLAAVFYAGIGMLVVRLANGTSPSVAVVLVPVFIVLGLILCCTCCCLPCGMAAVRDATFRGAGPYYDREQGEAHGSEEGGTEPVRL